MESEHRRLRLTSAVIATAAVLALTSCSSSDDGKDGASPARQSPQAAASASAPKESSSPSAGPEAADKKELLAAYDRHWNGMVDAFAKVSTKGTDIKKTTTGDALAQAESGVMTMRSRGQEMRGAPERSDPKVTLDMSHSPPRATVTECVDVAKWQLVAKKSGKPVPLPSERLTRYLNESKAEKWEQGWMLTDSKPTDRPC